MQMHFPVNRSAAEAGASWMNRVFLTGTGVHIPEPVITNAELVTSFNAWVDIENARRSAAGEELLAHSDAGFIEKASGILERHVLEKDGILDPNRMVPNIPERADDELSVQAEFAVASAKVALENAGRAPEEIDMIICSCAQHQRPYPAIAIEVQRALGCDGSAFDMNVACSASTFAMHVAVNLVRTGSARTVLVVSPEIMSGHLNWRDRQTHFIFGDASAAAIVEGGAPTDPPRGGFEVMDSRTWTEFSSNIRSNFGFLNRADESGVGMPDKLVTQQGQKVFKEVTAAACAFLVDFLDDNGAKPEDIKRYWLHQANLRMNRLLMRNLLGHEPSETEMPLVLHKYGNTASPGSLITFHENQDDLKPGDLGLICSYGAGYSIGSLLLSKCVPDAD